MIAVVVPARDEEQALPGVLAELRARLDGERFVVAVGANACSDRTAERARAAGALVAETAAGGYGHGCMAAIAAVNAAVSPAGYLFAAADGAGDPADMLRLVEVFEAQQCRGLVLGQRVRSPGFPPARWFENRVMGLMLGVLCGRFFRDIGPLRVIARDAIERIAPREMTYGWTVEAQLLAVRLGLPVSEISVGERPRVAGCQQVSGHSPGRSLEVGAAMLAAALRARLRRLPQS